MRHGSVAALTLLLGCGSLAPNSDGGADASSTDGQTSHGDSGGCSHVRVPLVHRSSADACPMARGPGNGTGMDAGNAACNRDSDCTMGMNGRCLATPFPPGWVCSYDTCYADSDCIGSVPCVCRSSASDSAPNVCAPAGDCVLDSDCGPCGYCSPSGNPFFPPPAWFCHQPGDTCINDSDCPPNPGGCQYGCNYDSVAAHWSCTPECPP